MASKFFEKNKEAARAIGRKGGEGNRSASLKKAWKDKAKIQKLYTDGASVAEIMELYGIVEGAVYRIINSYSD